MEKIIVEKSYNLQQFRETDWRPVDGETKISSPISGKATKLSRL